MVQVLTDCLWGSHLASAHLSHSMNLPIAISTVQSLFRSRCSQTVHTLGLGSLRPPLHQASNFRPQAQQTARRITPRQACLQAMVRADLCSTLVNHLWSLSVMFVAPAPHPAATCIQLHFVSTCRVYSFSGQHRPTPILCMQVSLSGIARQCQHLHLCHCQAKTHMASFQRQCFTQAPKARMMSTIERRALRHHQACGPALRMLVAK